MDIKIVKYNKLHKGLIYSITEQLRIPNDVIGFLKIR